MKAKIIVVPDGRFFFAQGIEEDYGAQGDTVAEAAEHFRLGLRSTMAAHEARGLKLLSGPPSDSVIADFRATPGAVEMEIEL